MTDAEIKQHNFELDCSQGFSAGNFANAYETTDIEEALEVLDEKGRPGYGEISEDFRNAFIVGFFGSYATHEIGSDVDLFREAFFSEAGKQCVAAGYCDERPEEEWE